MNFIPYLLSGLSFSSSVGAALVKGESKKQLGVILILTFFSNFFAALGYLFNPKGINGALSCGLGCIVSILNYYFRMKNKPIPKTVLTFYYMGFFIINLLGRNSFILTVIAILATFSFVVNLSQKNGSTFRLWKMGNNSLWLIYDIISRTYNQIALHGTIIIFTGLSAIYYDRKKENK